MELIKIDFEREVDQSLDVLSISTILTMLQKPKDQEAMVEATYNKHYSNPDSEYYHMTREQIKEAWEMKGALSRQYGSLLDDYIGLSLCGGGDGDLEMYMLDNDVENDERLNGLITSFENFRSLMMESGDMEFICREKTLYHKFGDHYVKGRFDALFYNKRTGKYIIIDWKSSKSIDHANRWQKLLGPAKFYDDCNWVTYTMQGYFYKTALVEDYLPEGTSFDDVEFLIVQLPGFILENGKDYMVHKPAFPYSRDFMDKVFDFAFKKKAIMDQKSKTEPSDNGQVGD